MSKHDLAIVIPTIREENIKLFLKKWKKEFLGHQVIVIEDNPAKTFKLPQWVHHYSWNEIDKELGKNSWIIPRRSAAIRSFGFYIAWKKKSQFILTLDDDCLPEQKTPKEGFLKSIKARLITKWPSEQWWNTLGGDVFPRGYPYEVRQSFQRTVIHHGLWSNIPDLDGQTQKKLPGLRTKPTYNVERVPSGKHYPMSSMNLAFTREILPALYMLLMGQDSSSNKLPYDRFDDIWAGIFSKKICDKLNLAVSSGAPSIHHDRASDFNMNIKKEKTGIEANEWLWKEVDKISLNSEDVKGCYLELSAQLEKFGDYWKTLSKAMKIWISVLE